MSIEEMLRKKSIREKEKGLLLAEFVINELKKGTTVANIAKKKNMSPITMYNIFKRPYVREKYGKIGVLTFKKKAGQMSIV